MSLLSKLCFFNFVFITFAFTLNKRDCYQRGEIQVPIRNSCCRKVDCVWDINSIVPIILKEFNPEYSQIKCRNCDQYWIKEEFYFDLDMSNAIQILKSNYQEQYEYLFNGIDEWKVFVTLQNEWILESENGECYPIKEPNSEMQSEYEKNYPTIQSKQKPEFYVNGYVFIHENLNTLNNGLIQSVIFLFFPSLACPKNKDKAWKEVRVFSNKEKNEQTFFNRGMAACKVFNSETGQHSILASGGEEYPEKKSYTNRSFIVPLFTNDPQKQIEQNVDLEEIEGMIQPRVFHQLICLKNKVYALGGYTNKLKTNIPLKSCESYDLITKKWEKISDMKSARQLFTVTAFREQIFIIGGKVYDPKTKQCFEDLTMDIFNPAFGKWVSFTLFQQPNPQKYFNDRAYCFVRQDMNLVIFGRSRQRERSELNIQICSNQYQTVELDLNTCKYQQTNDSFPQPLIEYEGPTDFGGIYYNDRYIFGFKQFLYEQPKAFLVPTICKYSQSSQTKFSIEKYKKFLYYSA